MNIIFYFLLGLLTHTAVQPSIKPCSPPPLRLVKRQISGKDTLDFKYQKDNRISEEYINGKLFYSYTYEEDKVYITSNLGTKILRVLNNKGHAKEDFLGTKPKEPGYVYYLSDGAGHIVSEKRLGDLNVKRKYENGGLVYEAKYQKTDKNFYDDYEITYTTSVGQINTLTNAAFGKPFMGESELYVAKSGKFKGIIIGKQQPEYEFNMEYIYDAEGYIINRTKTLEGQVLLSESFSYY